VPQGSVLGAVLCWGQGAQAPPVAAQASQFPLMLFPDGLRAAVGWGPGPSRIFGLEPRLPVLFLLFIRDLCEEFCNFLEVKLFADDVKVYAVMNHIDKSLIL
jgi:hypothetical protein